MLAKRLAVAEPLALLAKLACAEEIAASLLAIAHVRQAEWGSLGPFLKYKVSCPSLIPRNFLYDKVESS